MDLREWIAVECEWDEGKGNPNLAVPIVTATWDGMTPIQRSAYVMGYIDGQFNFHDDLLDFKLTGAMQGKFYLTYPCHSGIDLTVCEMLAAGILDFEWVSKGYEDKEEMLEREDCFDEEEENAEA